MECFGVAIASETIEGERSLDNGSVLDLRKMQVTYYIICFFLNASLLNKNL